MAPLLLILGTAPARADVASAPALVIVGGDRDYPPYEFLDRDGNPGQGLPGVRGNAQRIEQVIVNLVLNACQALPDPSRAIRASTRFDPDRSAVLFAVEDEGIGIPPENLPRLTDPFFTTKRDSGGTGLGLSVSASIVKEHGGTLEFRSEPGQGATVTLALPVGGAGRGEGGVEEKGP
jgi:signal transduction histidine kinase